MRLLELTPKQAVPPGPARTGFFEAAPGPVDRQSPPEVKVDFLGQLFAPAPTSTPVRWENARTGKAGWLPAVRGGWRTGARHEDRTYLPLTREVLRAHLSDETHIGLYPLLDGDLCNWLAAGFDGQAAMLDALAYLKAARTWSVPAALEVSRSGVGAHPWVFFAVPVPAEVARRLGTVLLREAMAVRGHMDLASYDRLFPSQDVLPTGGVGNLSRSRQPAATVLGSTAQRATEAPGSASSWTDPWTGSARAGIQDPRLPVRFTPNDHKPTRLAAPLVQRSLRFAKSHEYRSDAI
ncbi:MAG: hypothetical protein WCB57_00460 [Pseudonocardiaceae bacterium]